MVRQNRIHWDFYDHLELLVISWAPIILSVLIKVLVISPHTHYINCNDCLPCQF